MPIKVPDALKNRELFRIRNKLNTFLVISDIKVSLRPRETVNLLQKVQNTGKQLLSFSDIEKSFDLELAIFEDKIEVLDENGNIINSNLALSKTDSVNKSEISAINDRIVFLEENPPLEERLKNATATVYVNAEGDDSDTGLTVNNTKLTLSSAITAASALISAGADSVIINVLDGSTYSGNIILPSNVHLFAPAATYVGRMSLQQNCSVKLNKHYNAGAGCVIASGGEGRSYYECNYVDGRGVDGNITANNTLFRTSTSIIFFIKVSVLYVQQSGFGISDGSTDPGHIHFDIGDLYLAGNSAIGISSNFATTDIIGYVDHILEIGTPTNTVGIFMTAPSSAVQITACEIIADSVYLIIGGSLWITCPKMVGGKSGTPVVENSGLLVDHLSSQTGTSYTLVLDDAGRVVTMNNANANTLTIPANASVAFQTGTVIEVEQLGAGTTTIVGDTGVTLNGVSAGSGDISGQWKSVKLRKTGTNTWVAIGSIETVS